MATFEDLHPDQNPSETAIRLDMGRMAENVQWLISQWRAMALAGGDPRPNMSAVAKGLLGRLLRAYTFFQANPGEMDAISTRIGMTPQDITDGLIARRDALRAFRDAPMNTKAQAVNAVNALEAAFPIPKAKPAVSPFIDLPLPSDW